MSAIVDTPLFTFFYILFFFVWLLFPLLMSLLVAFAFGVLDRQVRSTETWLLWLGSLLCMAEHVSGYRFNWDISLLPVLSMIAAAGYIAMLVALLKLMFAVPSQTAHRGWQDQVALFSLSIFPLNPALSVAVAFGGLFGKLRSKETGLLFAGFLITLVDLPSLASFSRCFHVVGTICMLIALIGITRAVSRADSHALAEVVPA